MKIRVDEKSNYKAFFFNGKTVRLCLDDKKPISKPEFPEFYDVDIFETLNGLCNGGCSYCYLNGNKNGKIVENAVEKIYDYFGKMSPNQRPFQVALPGSGEIFMHPKWEDILKAFYGLNIVPNYTTNGMFAENENVIEATKKYVGGVAITCHPHLKKFWTKAAELYCKNGIRTNLHLIISDNKSIDNFVKIYNEWKDRIEHFVLLPLGDQQVSLKKEIDWDYLVSVLPKENKVAFGANFYPYLLKGGVKVSLYDPEVFGGFLALDKMKLYKSSFLLEERNVEFQLQ